MKKSVTVLKAMNMNIIVFNKTFLSFVHVFVLFDFFIKGILLALLLLTTTTFLKEIVNKSLTQLM